MADSETERFIFRIVPVLLVPLCTSHFGYSGRIRAILSSVRETNKNKNQIVREHSYSKLYLLYEKYLRSNKFI